MNRICFIDLSPIRGGAEVSLELMLKEVKSKSGADAIIADEKVFKNIPETIKKRILWIDKRILITNKKTPMGVFVLFALAFLGFRQNKEYDTAVTNTFKSHIFGLGMKLRRGKTKWIIYERDVPENLFVRILKAVLYEKADFVVFNSNYLKNTFNKTKNCGVVYNIIEHIKTEEEPDFKKFVFVGNLTYEKGFDRAIELFSAIKKRILDAELFVAGDAGYGKRVMTPDEEGVKYLGYKDWDELPRDAGFLILVNRRKESFSRAVAEGMMRGAVPVVLKGNGMDDYADKSNSLVFDEYDKEKIADEIVLAIKEKKAKLLSKNAKKTMLSFSSKSLQTVLGFLDSLT